MEENGQPAAGIQAPRRSRLARRTVGVILVAILVAVLALRETGAVNLDFYAARTSTNTSASTMTSSVWPKGQTLRLRDFALAPEVRTASRTPTAKEARDALRLLRYGGLPKVVGDLSIDVTAADLTGHYRLPLWKSAQCAFAVKYELFVHEGRSSILLKGSIRGDIECTVKGICSVRTLNRIMGKQIAAEVDKEIAKQREAKRQEARWDTSPPRTGTRR